MFNVECKDDKLEIKDNGILILALNVADYKVTTDDYYFNFYADKDVVIKFLEKILNTLKTSETVKAILEWKYIGECDLLIANTGDKVIGDYSISYVDNEDSFVYIPQLNNVNIAMVKSLQEAKDICQKDWDGRRVK